jgi:regulator of protease activity HflC (stomatin/prohibitin superfamily)
MVTGDLNAVLVEWVVQYRILDPPDVRSFAIGIRPLGQMR